MKKIFLKITAAALAAISLMCFGGCAGTQEDAQLQLPLSEEPVSLDPQVAQGYNSKTVVANCFEGLTEITADGTVAPAAARDMVVSPDGLTYVFALHTNNKWHINSNHEELFGENWESAIDLRVTAADFVFGLQRALSPQTQAPDAWRLYMIKNAEKVHKGELPVSALGVTAADEFTIQITLEHPDSEFLSVLSEAVAMPCKQVFFEATKGKHGLGAPYILCNGAFYLSRWYKGGSIVLRRNPDNSRAQAKVYSVTYGFKQDEQALLDNLADGIYAAVPLSAEGAKSAIDRDCTVKEFQNTVWGLAFNCSEETVSNPRLRTALIKAVNLDEIFAAAENDAAVRARSVIPPSCMIDGKSYSSYVNSMGMIAYNEGEAKQLFAEVCGENGCSITILCTQQYETAVRRIIQNWQRLFGLSASAKVEVLEESELLRRVESGDYQCALTQISTRAQTPAEFLGYFSNGGGICRFNSEGYNDLVKKLGRTASVQELVAGCQSVQDYLVQNGVFLPLLYRSSYVGISSTVSGIAFSHSGSIIKLNNAELKK